MYYNNYIVMCIYIYICMYACMYVCMCIYACMYVCMPCVCVYIYIYITCVYKYVYIYIYIYVFRDPRLHGSEEAEPATARMWARSLLFAMSAT